MSNLDEDQKRAFELMASGKNVFLTGGGGTGKSYVLELFIRYLKSKYMGDWKKYLGITSLTGSSALLIGGTTIHSFSGLGVSKLEDSRLIETISKRKFVKDRWKHLRVLIIDEISMMTPRTFRLLYKLPQFIRKNSLPFGGVQVILSGDFCQLSPILEQHLTHTMEYCFETPEWSESNINTVYFKKIHRQADIEFIETLQKIRLGISNQDTSSTLMSRFKKNLDNSSGIMPTQLFPTRERANMINSKYLEELKKENVIYDFNVSITIDSIKSDVDAPPITMEHKDEIEQKVISQLPISKDTSLCKGLQVILVINLAIDDGLVNGSKGIVTDFDDKGMPIVRFLNGKERAITLYTWEIDDHGLLIKADGIPLILGYGCTIHRSQGMTIDLAIIDIGKNVFTGSGGYGQVYVALSRVRSLDGLCILNFEPNRIKCHPKVIEYYNNLERASQVSDIVIGGGEVADDKSVDSDEISTDSTSSIGEHVISFEKLRDCEKPVVKRIIKKSKEEIKNGQFNIQTFFSKK